MLVLSRGEGESIDIDGACRITVVRIRGKVRIGIEADDEVAVLRSELEGGSKHPVSLCPKCGGHGGDHASYCRGADDV